jgi:hypothetical protein
LVRHDFAAFDAIGRAVDTDDDFLRQGILKIYTCQQSDV